ncbi:MAG TPA: hypothetical protein PKM25_05870 [Candidatus Ozemobacteraceae bacterium]|nr:hypothetical protein [Candidatus Ozemobacteraceae bacterium]
MTTRLIKASKSYCQALQLKIASEEIRKEFMEKLKSMKPGDVLHVPAGLEISDSEMRAELRASRPVHSPITDLQESALSTAINTGRFDAFEQFDSHVAHLHCEVAEVGQAYRGRRLESWAGSDGKPEGVAAELADVVILALSLAGFYQIDLDAAIRTKMVYNETRRQG